MRLSTFFCWLFVMMLWLPTCIGGWLVYFELINAAYMWIGSVILSLAIAFYLSVKNEEANSK